MVPFVLVLDFTASIALGGKIRKHINWSELKPLLPFATAGVGHRVHLGISSLQMFRLVGLLLVGSGLSLLWKAWA